MVKRYTFQQLLEHAANKEDIDRPAQDMEKVLISETVPVNRVQTPEFERTTQKESSPQTEGRQWEHVPILWTQPLGTTIQVPSLRKNMHRLLQERSFCQNVQRETERQRQTKENQVSGKISPARARQLIRL